MTVPAAREQSLLEHVRRLAALYGWRCYHTHDSRRSEPGFPDLVLSRAPRLIFAELKTATGRVTPAQQAWLDELATIGQASAGTVEVYVWRPADLQLIAELLARHLADSPAGVRPVTPLARHTGTLGGRP